MNKVQSDKGTKGQSEKNITIINVPEKKLWKF